MPTSIKRWARFEGNGAGVRKICFLACAETLPPEQGGAAKRRGDAFEHDLYVVALEPAFATAGLELSVLDWRASIEEFAGIELLLLGTAWDYQDRVAEFLGKLDAIAAQGIFVCNPPDLVRWNSDKRYLSALAKSGAPTVPTLWHDNASRAEVISAMDHFETDRVVVKRQVGAGGLGQHSFSPDNLPDESWNMGHPAMIQPFLPAILEEGEYSFIFIDGAFSHGVQKLPAKGEYRIQSLFGGTEADFEPSPGDLAKAQAVLDAVPFPSPLYARIDMVRLPSGELAVMEAEMIEPYLYPEQGPELGTRLAQGILNRLS